MEVNEFDRGYGISPAQYHAALDLMWGVLDTSYAKAGGKDVFTLIVERVRELEAQAKAQQPVVDAAVSLTEKPPCICECGDPLSCEYCIAAETVRTITEVYIAEGGGADESGSSENSVESAPPDTTAPGREPGVIEAAIRYNDAALFSVISEYRQGQASWRQALQRFAVYAAERNMRQAELIVKLQASLPGPGIWPGREPGVDNVGDSATREVTGDD